MLDVGLQNMNENSSIDEPLLQENCEFPKEKTDMKSAPRLAPILRYGLILFVIVLICILFVSQTVPEFNQYRLVKSYERSENDLQQQTRNILLWSSFFGDKTWSLPADTIGPDVFRNELNCAVYQCTLTNKHEFLAAEELYDAIVFHTAEPFPLINSIPKRRSPQQVYVFAQMEPPAETKHILSDEMDFYNWTMTYRLDSDIHWPYRHFEDIETGVMIAPAKSPAWRIPPVRWNDTQIWSLWRKKTRTAAWFVSHCGTLSKRDELAAALQQYIDVDIYGKCGTFKCARFNAECHRLLDEKYKFYFSFENSLCTDYVTEKLYNALDRQIIPVVYGGADYTRFLPPDSYINAESFPNVKELAEYLKYLADHPAEYMRYFWWRQHYKLSDYSPFCDLCEKLHSATFLYQRQTYTSIQDWWLNGSCRFQAKYSLNSES